MLASYVNFKCCLYKERSSSQPMSNGVRLCECVICDCKYEMLSKLSEKK